MVNSISTLPQLLATSVNRNPDRLALLFGNRTRTYAEFQADVNRIAAGMAKLGIRKQDKIAFFLPNTPEFLFGVFAAAQIGAVFVPINTAYTAEEAEYVLHHSEACAIFTSSEFLGLVSSMRERLAAVKHVVVIGESESPQTISWARFLLDGHDANRITELDPEDLASITYTSGTTDRPKGVMLSQYAYAFAPRMRAEGLGWTAEDRVLCLLPLFHVNALCHMCIGMLAVGGSIVLTEKFSASRFWDDIREYHVTTSSLMRTIPQILLSLPERPSDSDNPLRLVVALLSPEMHTRFEERFRLRAVPSYSLTEDILSVIGPQNMPKSKLGSCGLPLAPEVHRIRIVDESGKTVAPGQPGEIVKQSPTLMKGYYKNTEATAKALKDGWLYTGDLGSVDEDGYLYFLDRLKDVVRRGDENISSEEIERVLNSHPQIAESAVVAVPDTIRGEEVKAYIVLKSSATPDMVPPDEIWNFCKEHLAAFKIPRFLEYCEHLPKTPSSKVQKNILREQSKHPGRQVFDRLAMNPSPASSTTRR